MKLAALVAIASLLATCSVPGQPRPTATPINAWMGVPLAPSVTCKGDCFTYNVVPYERTHSKYGIGCMGNVPPGKSIPEKLPPQSYLASDIGKPEFPALTRHEREELRHFERTSPSKTLRIAWVDRRPIAERFIVFDAADGPCAVDHYSVLNGTCNEFYMPGETAYNTIAGSGCYPNDPRPRILPTITPRP